MIKKYKKRPVIVEAIKWTGNNLQEVIDFAGRHKSAKDWPMEEFEKVVNEQGLKIFSLEGSMISEIGDFIIKGIKGEIYSCKPDIFKKTYEEL